MASRDCCGAWTPRCCCCPCGSFRCCSPKKCAPGGRTASCHSPGCLPACDLFSQTMFTLLYWIFCFSFAFDFRGEKGGSVVQYLFLALALGSGVLTILATPK